MIVGGIPVNLPASELFLFLDEIGKMPLPLPVAGEYSPSRVRPGPLPGGEHPERLHFPPAQKAYSKRSSR